MSDFIRKQGKDPQEIDFLNPDDGPIEEPSVPEVASKAEAVSKPEVDPKPEMDSKPETEAKPEVHPEPEVKSKSEIDPKPEVAVEPEVVEQPTDSVQVKPAESAKEEMVSKVLIGSSTHAIPFHRQI